MAFTEKTTWYNTSAWFTMLIYRNEKGGKGTKSRELSKDDQQKSTNVLGALRGFFWRHFFLVFWVSVAIYLLGFDLRVNLTFPLPGTSITIG